MASTNKTTNLQLPQWEAMDKPERVDFNDAMLKVDTTVGTHLAENAQKHITESGKNTNGRYVKFDDGTQICTVNLKLAYSTTTTLLGTWYFPLPFIAVPITPAILSLRNGSNVSENTLSDAALSNLGALTLTSYAGNLVNVVLYGQNFISADYTRLAIIAIGRWK